jgi:DNA invertase Pin-like site-specific DNA recombinase
MSGEDGDTLEESVTRGSGISVKGSSRRKRGRPPVPRQTANRARAMRLAGKSWSQIADGLNLGRTTVRRLCEGLLEDGLNDNGHGPDTIGGDERPRDQGEDAS